MLAELDWLKDAPADFRVRLKAVRTDIANGQIKGVEEHLHALGLSKLDLNQLGQLATTVESYLDRKPAAGPLSRIKFGLIGAGTLSFLGPAIAGSALRHRVLATAVMGDYGSAVQDAIEPSSPIHNAGLDVVVILPDHRMLGLDRHQLAETPSAAVDAAIAMVRTMVESLEKSVSAVVISTVVPPLEPLFGSLDISQAGTIHSMITAFNGKLAEWAAAKGILLVDAARTASWIGLERWHDAEQWHASKMPFGIDLVPLYADMVARTFAAIRGTSRKCLVLDLDNTLWGGVIGDDGVEGIALGQGSAKGEAFLAIQQAALALRERGVVLAVCSKNNDDVARQPFRKHPDMILKEDHIALFTANWTDKATNLRGIAAALNIGLDALVFLDDNPAEREQVRRELPQVAVPELPDSPALYPRLLLCAGYFEAVGFAQEDRDRADAYKANVERAAIASSSDMVGYLTALEMVADIRGFDAVNRARIAQLINKSNQFNLTTRRYTEKDVADMETNPELVTLQIRLTDRFGPNGMISVVIVDRKSWEIDTWLMSCRVLGRRVEEAVLAQIAQLAKKSGAPFLTGRYVPSAKNQMVAEHYAKLGFERISADENGETVWQLDLGAYVTPDLPMRVDVAGLDG